MSRKVRAQPKVLVVADEPVLLALLELTLSRMGRDVERATTVGEAIAQRDRDSFSSRASARSASRTAAPRGSCAPRA